MSNEIKVIANDSDLVLRIESELEYDSLFKLIKERENKKRELFQQDFISSLEEDINRWYSVAEAGKILGGGKPIPHSSLTYYIDGLKEYILPEDAPSNKYMRLNYLSIIKMKMVLLLKDEFRLNGLKAEVGITGNPKNVVTRNDSGLPANDVDEDFSNRLEKLEAMNEMLFRLLIEKGEGGQPQLKEPLQALLTAENKLLEDQSSLLDIFEKQNGEIEDLKEENKLLKERIEKTEEYTQSMDKKHDINEDERKKILESEQKLNSIAETLRARQQAEEEWDQQGLFKKLRGNRSEFVTSRIKEILEEVSKR